MVQPCVFVELPGFFWLCEQRPSLSTSRYIVRFQSRSGYVVRLSCFALAIYPSCGAASMHIELGVSDSIRQFIGLHDLANAHVQRSQGAKIPPRSSEGTCHWLSRWCFHCRPAKQASSSLRPTDHAPSSEGQLDFVSKRDFTQSQFLSLHCALLLLGLRTWRSLCAGRCAATM
jgi:hypothetical protein